MASRIVLTRINMPALESHLLNQILILRSIFFQKPIPIFLLVAVWLEPETEILEAFVQSIDIEGEEFQGCLDDIAFQIKGSDGIFLSI